MANSTCPSLLGFPSRIQARDLLPRQWWLSGNECTCNAGDLPSPWVGRIPWRREWQPTLVCLPGEFHGQRSLVGYSPWGCVGHDLATKPPNHQVYFMPANVVQAVIPELPPGSFLPTHSGSGAASSEPEVQGALALSPLRLPF